MLLIFSSFYCCLLAQPILKKDTVSPTKLECMVVSVHSVVESVKIIPQRVVQIDPKQIKSNTSTMADVLSQSGDVYVQKTQQGGGSPVLRGFEANRILLTLDGIRLNNSITRSGHVQDIIKLDQNNLDNVEVLFGAGSTRYGTGALGGSINMFTKNLLLSNDTFRLIDVNVRSKYASANNEQTAHIDLSYGNKNIAFYTSASYSDFDDLRTGSKMLKTDPLWGTRREYVAQFDKVDSIVSNPNPLVQVGTEYNQLNLYHKTSWQINEYCRLVHSVLATSSSNIPRYDKLIDYRYDAPRYGEWYYGPQKHLINSLKLDDFKENKFYDQMTLILGHQLLEESRNSRRYQSDYIFEQKEQVQIWSLRTEFNKKISAKSKLLYGVESYVEKVNSSALYQGIYGLSSKKGLSRFPNGQNYSGMQGAFFALQTRLNDNLNASGGVRVESVQNTSTFQPMESQVIGLDLSDIQLINFGVVGHLGLNYMHKNWKVGGLVSKGYRAPNLDDYGKIRSKNGFLQMPSLALRPEQTYSVEGNLSFQQKRIKMEGGVFSTLLQNMIQLNNDQWLGQDSLVFDGEQHRVQTNQNSGRGVIYGVNAGLEFEVTKSISGKAKITYTYGQGLDTKKPLAHIPPVYGLIGLVMKKKKFTWNGAMMYNGAKKINRYSENTADNLLYATSTGTPFWYQINTDVSVSMKRMEVTVGLQNILDHHIRPFASGVSMGGRNFFMDVKMHF